MGNRNYSQGPQDIQRYLERSTAGDAPKGQQLVMGSNGRLMVVDANNQGQLQNDDLRPITQIAEDGFFG